jgi:hypothetical protein
MDSNPNLKLLAEQLTAAAALDRPPHNGMLIDLSGVLSHAARALRAFAAPPSTTDEAALEDHAERVSAEQPAMHAFMLDELLRHLELVAEGLEAGNVLPLRQFLDLYRL